ncbi:MAG: domain containing protein [Myxococcales bacterium]|nr:domain containing protein [Myxococcales bacterium]
MRTWPTALVTILGGASMASAAPSKPTLSFGELTVTGALDAKAVGLVIERSKTKLLGCYTKLLAKVPGLEGTATATFTIGTDGKVTAAAAPGFADPVEACIVATISRIKFAKPKDGQPVEVTYPLSFDHNAPGGVFASLTGTGDLGDGGDAYGGLIGDVNGDFNKSLYGRGGRGIGGTGQGTIGLGHIGTIGHGGTGSGYGRGGMRGRTTGSTVTVGQLTVTGELDQAIIRRYLRRNTQKLAHCYEKELMVDKTLQGMATATFTIGSAGVVSSSTATGLGNQDVESCVARVIKSIEFPKPKTGDVTVTSPLTMKPAPAEPAAPATTK